jgi:hypothetical protein
MLWLRAHYLAYVTLVYHRNYDDGTKIVRITYCPENHLVVGNDQSDKIR